VALRAHRAATAKIGGQQVPAYAKPLKLTAP
jgi:hypothetical protein